MNSTDPLLQPLKLKHLTLKNRVMSTGHEPAYAEDAKPKLRYQLYHEEKAKGGIALTVVGGSSNVAVDSPAAFGQIFVGDDDVIPYLQQMAARIHPYGTALMCQITHMGRRTSWNTEHWLPTIAPSVVREQSHRSFPKEMEISDIKRVVKAYGAAAARCQKGDMDGIEISSYGHLLDSFWTPLVNHRSDQYGGSLENRIRFSLEVFEEIRKQVGDDFIVGIRMSGDEDVQGGLTHQECVWIAQTLVATGMLDFVNIIKGIIPSDEALSHVIPSMGTPSAPHLKLAAAIKEKVDLPIFHAARINDVATARHAIKEGLIDMVGMTRAHMADPHIVAKIERGEEDQIRPCVGASYCINRIYGEGEALCLHNPATGREETMPHVIEKSKHPARRIVIVGAGPAGLEAARVCAERGHRVILFEASEKAGGQVRLAAQVNRRMEIIGITDWLFQQVQRLGVASRFGHYTEAEDVLAEDPDVVIVATGGEPNTEFLQEGAELVLTTWDILGRHVQPADEVLLFDDNSQNQGLSCAEFIAEKGSKLELVSPDRMIGQEVGGTIYPAYFKTFYDRGVSMTLNHRLTAVSREGNKLRAHLSNEYNNSTLERLVDQVVVEHGTLPIDGLYSSLKSRSSNLGELALDALIAGKPQELVNNPAGRYQLFRVGDAVASRNIHAAIYDSLRLCKAI
ncbi:MAG: NADH:flavin oxidoreductase [SAR324 cluster bacterium]|nr:NADH:flavin oxidoreductase [SAR324 cluster bacterium]